VTLAAILNGMTIAASPSDSNIKEEITGLFPSRSAVVSFGPLARDGVFQQWTKNIIF